VKRTEQEQPIQLRKAPLDVQAEVRRRAYQLYEQRGKQEGFELEDWLQAETEVLDNPNIQKAA
jgi:hypothetical protein